VTPKFDSATEVGQTRKLCWMHTSLRRKTQEKKVQVPGYHWRQGVGWACRVESRKEQYFSTLQQVLRFPSSGSVWTAAIVALPTIARNCPSKWCVGPFKMSVYPLNLSVFEHRSDGLPWTLYLIFRIPLRLWGFLNSLATFWTRTAELDSELPEPMVRN